MESLRDGRSVFYRGERGERVADVPAHPVLGAAVRHAALDYELAEDPRFRSIAVGADGFSRYYTVPANAADLRARQRLIDASTREGRTLVLLIKEIGTDALFALLALARRLGPDYAERIEAFYRHCRDNDLALAVAQTDAKGDRGRGPSAQANPDAYVRVVDRSTDGIVVRGVKVHTSVSVNANELIVLPTRSMKADDRSYAVAFAVPVNTPGLSLVASRFLSPSGRPDEHPLSADRKMVETTTLFDDVFVPWSRVFMCGETELAGELARGFVQFHRFTAISYKLPLVDALVGSGLAVAEANGIQRASHVRGKLAWLISYAETVRAFARLAADQYEVIGDLAVPNTLMVNIGKLHFAQNLHQAVAHVQDLAGGLLVTYPSVEDLEHPEHGETLRRAFAGADPDDGAARMRLVRMISDLTTGEYGGYQEVLAVHAEGSIEAEKLTILSSYLQDGARAYARWLAGLEADGRVPEPAA